MVGARLPERLLQPVREPVLVAEQHALEDRASFSRETGRRGVPQPDPQPVGDPAEPAAVADDTPPVDVQDDVDALPAQPGALVETVPRAGGRVHDREQADDGALWRRAAERQLELDALVDDARRRT